MSTVKYHAFHGCASAFILYSPSLMLNGFVFNSFRILSVFRDESFGLLAIHVVSWFIFIGLTRLGSKLKVSAICLANSKRLVLSLPEAWYNPRRSLSAASIAISAKLSARVGVL